MLARCCTGQPYFGCTFIRLLLRCAGGFFDCIELIQGAETKQKSGIAKKC